MPQHSRDIIGEMARQVAAIAIARNSVTRVIINNLTALVGIASARFNIERSSRRAERLRRKSTIEFTSRDRVRGVVKMLARDPAKRAGALHCAAARNEVVFLIARQRRVYTFSDSSSRDRERLKYPFHAGRYSAIAMRECEASARARKVVELNELPYECVPC